jgi:hypothetical protein
MKRIKAIDIERNATASDWQRRPFVRARDGQPLEGGEQTVTFTVDGAPLTVTGGERPILPERPPLGTISVARGKGLER